MTGTLRSTDGPDTYTLGMTTQIGEESLLSSGDPHRKSLFVQFPVRPYQKMDDVFGRFHQVLSGKPTGLSLGKGVVPTGNPLFFKDDVYPLGIPCLLEINFLFTICI